MAKMAPPKKSTKGTPVVQPSNNLSKGSSEDFVGLNFKVEAEFRREFKTFAAEHDLKMNDLLKRSFRLFQESQK